MHDDPTISRIRNVRHQISARYHHDVAQLIAHYVELEKRYHDRVIVHIPHNSDEEIPPEKTLVAEVIKESPQPLAGNF